MSIRRVGWTTILMLAATTWGLSQETAPRQQTRYRPSNPGTSRPVTAARTSTPTMPGRPAGGGTSTANGSPTGPSINNGYRPTRPAQPRPTDIYSGARFLGDTNYGNWNRCYRYLSNLRYRYGFLGTRSLLWRAATGSSPLTPGSLRLAIRESRSASRELLVATDALDGLILRYELGELPSKDFRKQVEQRTDLIRHYAKQIRKDRLLDFIDVRKNDKTAKNGRAVSLNELKALSASLRQYALQLAGALNEYSTGELASVVSLDHLEQPSLDTLSKNIDSLAKTIEKSAKKL